MAWNSPWRLLGWMGLRASAVRLGRLASGFSKEAFELALALALGLAPVIALALALALGVSQRGLDGDLELVVLPNPHRAPAAGALA